MGSTKIINVSRDDTLEEILEVFRGTPAEEVIFVLPKKSKSIKDAFGFDALHQEATNLDKKVSILCADENLNKMAAEHGFSILVAKESSVRKPRIKVAANTGIDAEDDQDAEEEYPPTKNEDDELGENENRESNYPTSNDYQSFEDTDSDNSTSDYKIVPMVAKYQSKRGLSDIVRPATDAKNLRVVKKKDSGADLSIKKMSKLSEEADSEIREMWRGGKEANFLKESDGSSFWDKLSFKSSSTPKKQAKKRDSSKRIVVTLGVTSLILISIIVYVSFGSAKIYIEPKKQPLSLQLKVTVSDKFSSVDTSFNRLPGQLFNIEKSASQTFQSTGQKEVAQKARGQITVYNNYGTTAQVLIATTRFESKEGLIFRTLKTVTVPGTKVENGKIIPGSIVVEVIADKPGQAYNIAAGGFNIPAFKEKGDNDRYQKVYGESSRAMKGGMSGLAKVVTEKDYNAAKDSLTQNLKDQLTESLKSQTADFKILAVPLPIIGDIESTAEIDTAADEFTMSIKGSIMTIGFRQEDLKKLIEEYVEKTGEMTVLPERLDLSFDKIIFDKNLSTLVFTVVVNGDTYSRIEEEKIRPDLFGKNTDQIREYFKNMPAVTSVKIILSPVWVTKIPKDNARIKLEILYN